MTTVPEKSDDTGASPGEVLDLLRKEALLYERLRASALQQRSLVTGDDLNPLLAALVYRQKLSAELTRIGTQLSPIRRDWSNCRQRFSPSQQAEADQLVSDITDRLRRVMESDEEDVRLLRARKQTVAEELRSTHVAGEALSAYRAPSGRQTQIDQTDETSP